MKQRTAAISPSRLVRAWAVAFIFLLTLAGVGASQARADQTFGAEMVDLGPGLAVQIVPPGGGAAVSATAALLLVELEDGTSANAFCIQRYIPTTFGNTYVTEAWSDKTTSLGATSVGPIRWILDNAPPRQSVDDFAADVGVALTPAEAYAAIQATIWHFSDGVSLGGTNPPAVIAAYDYLVAQAQANADYIPADPSISLSPPPVPGEAGGLVGPFTIAATPGLSVDAALAPGAPAGVEITDANGQPATGPFADGDQLYLRIPESTPAGSAKITVSALADRRDLVLMPDDPPASQRLLLASTVPAIIDAEAMGMWVAQKSSDAEPAVHDKKPKRPRLDIVERVDRNKVRPGKTVRYRIVVRNRGNAAARDVRICARVPRNATVNSRGGGSLSGGSLCWRVRNLPAGKSATRTFVVRFDRDARPGRAANVARVEARNAPAKGAKAAVHVLPAPREAVAEGLVTG